MGGGWVYFYYYVLSGEIERSDQASELMMHPIF